MPGFGTKWHVLSNKYIADPKAYRLEISARSEICCHLHAEFSRVHLKNFRTHFLFSWKLPISKCYVINLGERLSKVSPRYFASCSIKIAIFVQLCPPCGYIIPNHCLTRIIRNKTRVAVTNNKRFDLILICLEKKPTDCRWKRYLKYIDVRIGAVNLISTNFTQTVVIYDEHVSEDGSEPNM